jgi:hypothetical protein
MSDEPLTDAEFDAIAERIDRAGREFSAAAMEQAAGSPDMALAILAVAVSDVIDAIDEDRRAEVLRNYLESFEDKAGDAG